MSDLLGGGFGFVCCGFDLVCLCVPHTFKLFSAWAARWHKLERVPLNGFALGGVWLNLGANATVYVFFIGTT